MPRNQLSKIIFGLIIVGVFTSIFIVYTSFKKDDIQQMIDDMSINEKIGQLVIGSYNNLEELLPVIKDNKLGGVILYKKNITSIVQTMNDISLIKQENDSSIDMFISVDQEGGKVNRLPEEMGTFDSAMSIGNRNDEIYAYNAGKKIGESLTELGFNLDFAPVLDIFSNPKNTVIGERAFGTTSLIVSKMGIEVIKGLHDEGIIATAKHFPGHGDTEIDSHVGLPIVDKSVSDLMQFEFKPFIDAIGNDIDMIMIAHIILSKVDNLPSTLSRNVVTGILRNELNYEGVIITDDMSMDAINQNYTIADASIKAINAGCDIILIKGIDNTKLVIQSLKDAVKDDTLTEERINESLYRILNLKNKYNLIKKR